MHNTALERDLIMVIILCYLVKPLNLNRRLIKFKTARILLNFQCFTFRCIPAIPLLEDHNGSDHLV